MNATFNIEVDDDVIRITPPSSPLEGGDDGDAQRDWANPDPELILLILDRYIKERLW